MAAALLLCAAPVASAAPGTAPGPAEGRPPAHGGAPLYISDYSDNTVLRLPPGGGAPVMVAVTGLIRPTGMVLAPSGDLYISDTGNNRVV
ncbi:NHL repeat-containing protein, partial [Streptomyces sp. Termitarium-T10T-6]